MPRSTVDTVTRLSAEQQKGLDLSKSVDEGHGGARGRLPEKEAIGWKGGRDLAYSTYLLKNLPFSASREEEEGLPLPTGN